MIPAWRLSSVESALRFWQRALRLEDWDIRIRLMRATQLGPDVFGMMLMGSRGKRRADVGLLCPEDVSTIRFDRPSDRWDWELTIVHELLHILWDDAIAPRVRKETSPFRIAEERAVHRTAVALVAANRERRRPRAPLIGHVHG